MQVTESKEAGQVVATGRKCTVCDHPDIKRIDTLLADRTVSKRGIAVQFGLAATSVQRHANLHLASKVKAAIARKEAKEGDIFMERHEHLYRESLQYIEDAKQAVKMQKVTAEIEENGQTKLVDRYQEFRDVGAMAPALGAATALQRLLGDATQRFGQPAPGSGVNVHLSVILPRAIEPTLRDKVDSLSPVIAIESATHAQAGDQVLDAEIIEAKQIEAPEE